MDGHVSELGTGRRRVPLYRRLVRVGVEPGVAPAAGVAPAWRPGFAGTLAISAWCGVFIGGVEVAVLLVRGRLEGPAASGVLNLNRQYLWMIPAANLAVATAVGLVLAVLGRLFPARLGGSRPVWFAMLTLLGLALLWPIKAIQYLAVMALAAGLAARLSAPLARRGRPIARGMYASLPLMLALVGGRYAWERDRAAHGEARGLAALPAAPGSAENVILIVLDTVRADHLSLYGYERDTTPFLKRLGDSRGVVFEFARSPAPWTLPSHGSLFTGRWPHELEVSQQRPFDGRFPTIAERLAGRGYATAGFVSNMYYLNHWYGLDRGFLHFEDYPEHRGIDAHEVLRNAELGRRVLGWTGLRANNRAGDFGIRKQADDVNRHLLAWLDGRGSGAGAVERPFFAFLNYLDAHDPYVVPPGRVEPFGLAGSAAVQETLRTWHAVRKENIDPRTRQLMTDAYDTCVAYIDRALEGLFGELEARGLDETTWVVITSDHGEHLGEHELYLHGHSLYRPLIDVPLVVVPPKGRGIAPRRVGVAVSTREVARTVAELAGVEGEGAFPGRSLARFWEGEGVTGVEGPVLSEADIGIKPPKPGKVVRARAPVARGPMQALAGDGFTYMKLGDGSEELYDLEADPGEEKNRAGEAEERGRVDGLRQELEATLAR
jgi:arylsulfatase A-like enzyme